MSKTIMLTIHGDFFATKIGSFDKDLICTWNTISRAFMKADTLKHAFSPCRTSNSEFKSDFKKYFRRRWRKLAAKVWAYLRGKQSMKISEQSPVDKLFQHAFRWNLSIVWLIRPEAYLIGVYIYTNEVERKKIVGPTHFISN